MIISQTIISTPPGLAECDEPDLAETGSERRSLLVGPLHHQMRLDRTLAALVPEFSRSYLQQLIEQDGVTLNGRPICKAALKVRVGDQLVIELRPTAQSQSFTPESMVLPMVYEDSYLRVINKPAGLVVHPAPGHWSGTLMNGLLGLDTLARELPRAGIVHRLDKDTSGLMVVARTREVMDALVRAIAAREVKRQYLALAHGQWQGPTELQVRARPGQQVAHGGGRSGVAQWQAGTYRHSLPGLQCNGLFGTVPAPYGPHPSDPGAHGRAEASFAG